jgi:hypothetical protein
VFLVDNKEHKSPFNVPKFWLFKAMLPSEPKYLFEYLKVPDVIALLGPEKHRIKLKYGPILSNEIELEVEGLHQLKENVIYCSPYVKEMGDSLFGKKH